MALTVEAALNRIIEADLPDFMDRPIDSVQARGSFGDMPLHVAAIWGDAELVTVFLDAGADINAQGEDDYTPLHYAIEQDKVEVARLLIARGASLQKKDRFGHDPFYPCSFSTNEAMRVLAHENGA